jgi:hypothetical protein
VGILIASLWAKNRIRAPKTQATASTVTTIAKEELITTDLSCTVAVTKGQTTTNSGIENLNNSKMDFKAKRTNLNLKTRTDINRTIHTNKMLLKNSGLRAHEQLEGVRTIGEVEVRTIMIGTDHSQDKRLRLPSEMIAIIVCQNKVLRIEEIQEIAITSKLSIMVSETKTDRTRTTIKITTTIIT